MPQDPSHPTAAQDRSHSFPDASDLIATEVQQEHAEYRSVVDICPAGLLVHRDFRILFANPAALELFGAIDEAQLIGKNILDYMHHGGRGSAERGADNPHAAGSFTSSVEQQWIDLSGNALEVEVASKVCVWKGQPATQVIVCDIRERKRAEHDLRHSEERLRLAVEASRVGTWHWNIQTDTQVWSERCLELLGRAGDPPRRIPSLLEAVYPDDRERISARLRRGLAGGTEVADECRVVWPDGSIHWLSALGRVFLDGDGTPERMEGILLDITEQRRLDEQLKETLAVVGQQNATLESQHVALIETNARLEEAVAGLQGLATTDGLTGLKNHRAFQESLGEAYVRAIRNHAIVEKRERYGLVAPAFDFRGSAFHQQLIFFP